ncbi:hypothetical protein [Tetragenococcus solitarius]|uniref:Uncharacterized protein n=1 Tax=Tetragenococcus solitarius TaxID=71453 RepID=A0ABP6KTR6_9ENTE|nr:hypothetical protein [Tetragenococcus solitarius]
MILSSKIIPIQITKVFYPFIVGKTKDGHYLHLNIAPTDQKDTIFWEIMNRILRANLWIPVDKNSHQLLEDGWLEVQF